MSIVVLVRFGRENRGGYAESSVRRAERAILRGLDNKVIYVI
jgi:hypothetical protein